MKPFTQIAAFLLLALAIDPAIAQQSGSQKSAAQPASTPAEIDQQFAKMQEQMRLMQSQMEQLAKTKDPAERQRLLESHWASMQQMMTTMHGAWGGMAGAGGHMMGGPMMGRHMMWDDYRKLTPEELRQRQ